MREYFAPLGAARLPEFVWIPHAATPAYTQASFNVRPTRQILLSGSTSLGMYPIREWLLKTYQPEHSDGMVVLKHPGYRLHGRSRSVSYALKLREHYCAVATTMIYRRVVSKIFEIPATGSLLLVNLDLQPMLSALGFTNMWHYVGFDDADPEPMIDWVLDPVNSETIDDIRSRGMMLVRSRHTTDHRARSIDDYFTLGLVPHPLVGLDSLARRAPCPMKGYNSTAACIQDYEARVRRYHHTLPKTQPAPISFEEPSPLASGEENRTARLLG